MMDTASKSTRDAAFTAFAATVAAVASDRFGLSAAEGVLITTVVGGVLAFGWRALRHFAPWVDDGS